MADEEAALKYAKLEVKDILKRISLDEILSLEAKKKDDDEKKDDDKKKDADSKKDDDKKNKKKDTTAAGSAKRPRCA